LFIEGFFLQKCGCSIRNDNILGDGIISSYDASLIATSECKIMPMLYCTNNNILPHPGQLMFPQPLSFESLASQRTFYEHIG